MIERRTNNLEHRGQCHKHLPTYTHASTHTSVFIVLDGTTLMFMELLAALLRTPPLVSKSILSTTFLLPFWISVAFLEPVFC